jgi:hypothetical protein
VRFIRGTEREEVRYKEAKQKSKRGRRQRRGRDGENPQYNKQELTTRKGEK